MRVFFSCQQTHCSLCTDTKHSYVTKLVQRKASQLMFQETWIAAERRDRKKKLGQLLTFRCWLESHNLQLRRELSAASALQARENKTVREIHSKASTSQLLEADQLFFLFVFVLFCVLLRLFASPASRPPVSVQLGQVQDSPEPPGPLLSETRLSSLSSLQHTLRCLSLFFLCSFVSFQIYSTNCAFLTTTD